MMNMIMLLLAMATVLTREPQQLKLAAARCVFFCGSCLVTIFSCQKMAGQSPIIPQLADHWPIIMAWMPVFLYGPMAVWLLDHVKT